MANVLYEANPSLLRTHPFGTVLLFLLLLAGIVIAIASGAIGASLGLPAQVVGISGIAMVVVAFVWLFAWFIASKMDHLVITNDEVVWSHGLISKQFTEISLSSVRTMRVNQSLMQRIMNAGDVMIFTSGDQPELFIRGMPEPGRIRDFVQSERRKD